MKLGKPAPRGQRSLIYVSDPSNTTSHLGDPTTEEELRNVIRNYALGDIDTAIQEIFAECMTTWWRTDLCPYDTRPNHERNIPLMDAGTMPVEIYIDECHRQGMEFLAGFRMNDRHGHHPDYFKMLCEEKPEWVLREFAPSWRGAPKESHEYGCSLNYAVEGVREFLLSIMLEAVNRFDGDGVELNYTRLIECFPRDEAAASADIMTDFIRQLRAGMNQKSEGLVLGVRVTQQLAGCLAWGLDVPTWIREGLIDYVAPGDFGFTDFNEKWEDFTSIAQEHDCYVYPQTQPKIGIELDHNIIMTPAQYRAALTNIWAAGADGFSVQNHFFHWGRFNVGTEPDGRPSTFDDLEDDPTHYPNPLKQLKEMKAPAWPATGERHYTFLPLWGDRQDCKGMSWVYEKEQIVLDRNKEGASGTFRFRICEALSATDASLIIQAIELTEDDVVEIAVNGVRIPSNQVKIDLKAAPPTLTILDMDPPFTFGDNELRLALLSCTSTEGKILVEQLDCYVPQ